MRQIFKIFGLIPALIFMVACTGSKNDQTDREILESQSVFDKSTLLASFDNSDGVIAFDDANRPIMANETMNCPTMPPTDGGGGSGGEMPGDDDSQNPDDPVVVTPPPPPPTCDDGMTYNGQMCVSICNDDQIFAQGQCYDKEVKCEIANGDGLSRWLANSYGNCQAMSCDPGYKLENDQCVALCKSDEIFNNGRCVPMVADCKHEGREGVKIWLDAGYGKCHASRNCKMPDGKGMKRYNVQTLLYDNCEVSSCDKGFKPTDDNKKCENICGENQVYDGKKCLPSKKDCQIAGGVGEKSWNSKKNKYGWCEVVSCNDGFIRTGNACRRPNDRGGDGDPLIVDLGADINNAQGINLSSQIEGILFDILGLNAMPNPFAKKQISWTQEQRYQFVVKPNEDGQVLGINEMFGDNTLGPDGLFSKEGFEALSKYDQDKNGIIDTEDPVYNELYLWHDANRNGVSDAGELTSLNAAGISSIDLLYDPNFYEIDQYGNKTTFKSIVRFFDGRRTLIFDLWFKYLEPTTTDDGTSTGGGGSGDGSNQGDGSGTGGGGMPAECPVAVVDDNF